MQLQLTGKNLELTEALKNYVDEKIGGLAKFNEHVTEIRVTLEDVREDHTLKFKAAAQFHVSHEVLYTEEVAADMYAAIDIVQAKLKHQIQRYKDLHGGGKLHRRLFSRSGRGMVA